MVMSVTRISTCRSVVSRRSAAFPIRSVGDGVAAAFQGDAGELANRVLILDEEHGGVAAERPLLNNRRQRRGVDARRKAVAPGEVDAER